MIEQVTLVNFHKHENLTVDFKAGLNIITGETDAGKSALLRAIYWVLFNRPLGDGYILDGKDNAQVILKFSDGNKITRTKSSKENSYTINDDAPLKAVSTGVPEPVQKILNMGQINYQDQWHPPFMLSMKPPEVARYLNSVSGLSQIDSTSKNIKARASKTKTLLKNAKADVKQSNQEISDLVFIDKLEEQVLDLETVREKAEIARLRSSKLHTCLDTYKAKQDEIDGKEWIFAAKKELDILVQGRAEMENLATRISTIRTLVSSHTGSGIRIKKAKALLKSKTTILKLEKLQPALDELDDRIDAISSKVSKYKNLVEQIQKIKQDIKKYEKHLKEIMPDACPLCGEVIK